MKKEHLGADAAAVDAAGAIVPTSERPHVAHTPGPWMREGLLVYALHHYGWEKGAPRMVNRFSARVDAYVFQGGSHEEADANAHLIAAAPELLEALKAVTEHMDRAGGDAHGMPECPWCGSGPYGDDHAGDCELMKAREAIAKAEGQ